MVFETKPDESFPLGYFWVDGFYLLFLKINRSVSGESNMLLVWEDIPLT